MTIIFFDFETTGIGQFSTQRAIQLAWTVTDHNLKIVSENDFYIKGQTEINTNFHKNISVEMLNKDGSDLMKVLILFIQDILNVVKTNGKLVAHNISFDIDILYNEIQELNISNFPEKNLILDFCFCTLKNTIDICKLEPQKWNQNRYKYPKLSELYKFLFNKEPEITLHNATNDVKILYDCFKELNQKKLITF